jgi:hypothetical protein
VTGIFPHDDEIGHTIHWMPRSFITQGGCTHLSILALHKSPFWL